MPGACSPSRRVVSKIRDVALPSAVLVASFIGATFVSLSNQGIIWRSSPPHLLELGRLRLLPKSEELREAGVGLGDPSACANVPSWISASTCSICGAGVVVDHARAAL